MATSGDEAGKNSIRRNGDFENPGEGVFKVVLIGESGSGKTSFVELMRNFASQRGNDFKPSEIRSFISPGVEGPMSTDTTTCSTHRVDLGEFMIDIIDTPGLADTRGEEQNKENIDNIIAALKEASYVNCVCLVINGTQSRLNSLMKTVVKEIKNTLSPEVVDNFIVVLTKVSDAFNTCFEVTSIVEFGLSIKSEHIFTFDNPYARWNKTKNIAVTSSPLNVKFEFQAVFGTLEKMLSAIKLFKSVQTLNFGELHEVINKIKEHLPGLSKNYENKVKMEEKIDNFLRRPKRVCSYEKAIVEIKLGSKNIICMKPKCNTNCHVSCTCRLTALWTGWCACFEKGVCKTCTHHVSEYTKKDYIFKKEEVEDERFDDLGCSEDDAKKQLKSLKDEIVLIEKVFLQELVKLKAMAKNSSYAIEAIELVEDLKKQIERMPGLMDNRELVEMLNGTIQVSLHNSGERNPHEEDNQEERERKEQGNDSERKGQKEESECTEQEKESDRKERQEELERKEVEEESHRKEREEELEKKEEESHWKEREEEPERKEKEEELEKKELKEDSEREKQEEKSEMKEEEPEMKK